MANRHQQNWLRLYDPFPKNILEKDSQHLPWYLLCWFRPKQSYPQWVDLSHALWRLRLKDYSHMSSPFYTDLNRIDVDEELWLEGRMLEKNDTVSLLFWYNTLNFQSKNISTPAFYWFYVPCPVSYRHFCRFRIYVASMTDVLWCSGDRRNSKIRKRRLLWLFLH